MPQRDLIYDDTAVPQFDGSKYPVFKEVDSRTELTYWSGLDAAIFFGDLYMGEIVTIEYGMQEATTPLFCYADFTYQTAMKGARLVQGSFTMNFQQSYLIYMMLEHFRNPPGSVPQKDDPYKPKTSTNSLAQIQPTPSILRSQGDIVGLILNPLEFLTSPNAATMSQDFYTASKEIIKAQADENMEKYWLKGKRQAGKGQQKVIDSLLYRTRQSITRNFTRFEVKDGFNITINLGGDTNSAESYLAPGIPLDFEDKHSGMADKIEHDSDVSLALRFGPKNVKIQIIGVDITSVSMVVDDSGRSLLVSYTFIARDMI